MSIQKKWVSGDVEHGIADAGSNAPVKIGGLATEEEPTAVEPSERVQISPDLRGNVKVVGNVANSTVDRGNPIKVGGQARTTNPTAVSDADRVGFTADDVGRQITVPHQVRDLIFTAAASTGTLAEVELLAGVASAFNDLIEITCANNTSASVRISIRDTTGGAVIRTLNLLAVDSIQQTFPVPVPQNTAATAWTIQNAGTGDISDTVITCSALFVRNV